VKINIITVSIRFFKWPN